MIFFFSIPGLLAYYFLKHCPSKKFLMLSNIRSFQKEAQDPKMVSEIEK
jgi:hypothetical protein